VVRGVPLSAAGRGAAGMSEAAGRLDRFLSQAARLTRSQSRGYIRRGRVMVDGVSVRDPGLRLDAGAEVCLDGRPVALPQPLYLMMHKPCGLLSATRDGQQQTVLSLLPEALAARLHLVGRLDKDTSGLLLLSDDGDWSHRISSPRHHCPKVYRAELAEPLPADAGERLARGMRLRGEEKPCAPALLCRLGERQVRITVTEGRYHLVRRLFAALGNRVLRLHRERIGGLPLDPALQPGQWRQLSPAECAAVFARPLPVVGESD
jgi:16S rRNA pseudouridine516 synthase